MKCMKNTEWHRGGVVAVRGARCSGHHERLLLCIARAWPKKAGVGRAPDGNRPGLDDTGPGIGDRSPRCGNAARSWSAAASSAGAARGTAALVLAIEVLAFLASIATARRRIGGWWCRSRWSRGRRWGLIGRHLHRRHERARRLQLSGVCLAGFKQHEIITNVVEP